MMKISLGAVLANLETPIKGFKKFARGAPCGALGQNDRQ